jgi:hypothetical protein
MKQLLDKLRRAKPEILRYSSLYNPFLFKSKPIQKLPRETSYYPNSISDPEKMLYTPSEIDSRSWGG